jgi:hypothetical protein
MLGYFFLSKKYSQTPQISTYPAATLIQLAVQQGTIFSFRSTHVYEINSITHETIGNTATCEQIYSKLFAAPSGGVEITLKPDPSSPYRLRGSARLQVRVRCDAWEGDILLIKETGKPLLIKFGQLADLLPRICTAGLQIALYFESKPVVYAPDPLRDLQRLQSAASFTAGAAPAADALTSYWVARRNGPRKTEKLLCALALERAALF